MQTFLDCDDSNSNVTSNIVFYLDNDGDGYYRLGGVWIINAPTVVPEELALHACRDSRWLVQGLTYTFSFNSAFYGNNTWNWSLKGLGDCNDNNPFIHPERFGIAM
ncbi:MAG: hypothetical protein MUF42_13915 [Cytophagaceae bacterium]|nr:hypothetical protein [Cytophagaceae bacterium]